MLKAGNKRALKLFGFSDSKNLKIENLKLNKETLCIGENLNFSFDLIINKKKESKVRLEYAVYFRKSNGKLSKKIFKLTENTYPSGKQKFLRKHSFKLKNLQHEACNMKHET